MDNKGLGQFFTPKIVADFMVHLAKKDAECKVLEPASGRGIFIKVLKENGYKNIVGYEIDPNLDSEYSELVKNESFISANISTKFDLIIGNPPYVRWKNLCPDQKLELNQNKLWNMYFNSLCDYLYIFILKSVEILSNYGELIFITPDYWLSTTHAQTLRDYLVKNGYFTHIINFVETPIFPNVTSSMVIFRYIKSISRKHLENKINIIKYYSKKRLTVDRINMILDDNKVDDDIERFTKEQFGVNKKWILAPDTVENRLNIYEGLCKPNINKMLFNDLNNYATLSDIADIGNGLVSGLDKAFKIPKSINLTEREERSTVNVVKAKSLRKYYYHEIEKYIFVKEQINNENELINLFSNFHRLLFPYKDLLDKRYNYNKPLNYWEWAFPRNLSLFNKDLDRIFVPCKERISHKKYFRFAYAEANLFPTQDVTAIILKPNTKESIFYILALLNSDYVFEWIRHKGIIKGNIVEFSEKPLASLPVKLINWENENEIILHNNISSIMKEYIVSKNRSILEELNSNLQKLINS
ncbi:MAG: Eco57I restriction-modification methylase domain-containing protein [Bellilinea sp.]